MITFPLHRLPKVLVKPFLLREYRMTVQWIKDLKNDWIPKTKRLIDNYGKGFEIRGIEYYKELLEYYEQCLLEKESHLEDIKLKMKRYYIPLE